MKYETLLKDIEQDIEVVRNQSKHTLDDNQLSTFKRHKHTLIKLVRGPLICDDKIEEWMLTATLWLHYVCAVLREHDVAVLKFIEEQKRKKKEKEEVPANT